VDAPRATSWHINGAETTIVVESCSPRIDKVKTRPTIQSMQKWADLLDDQSYTFDNMLPYYEKSTSFSPPDTRKGPKNASITADLSVWNNTTSGGPVHVAYPSWDDPFSTWLEKAFDAAGFASREDGFNSGRLLGHGWATKTVNPKNGHRSSSTDYLEKVDNATSLTIYHNTLAKQILFTNKTASGVLVSTGGIDFNLTARNEIIVSAGTYQSPQLLMVSGIGPRHTLEAYGIEVVSDLPGVGQNMWDHAIVSVSNRVTTTSVSTLVNDASFFKQANAEFIQNAAGPLTSPFGNWGWEKVWL
jgi:choline dehydrogenase